MVRKQTKLFLLTIAIPAVLGLAACAPAPLAPLASELAHAWPLPLTGLHRLAFEAGAVTLTLGFGDAH